MRVVRYHEHGDPEVLVQEEAVEPEAGPGQVLLRMEAVGINFSDVQQRRGTFPLGLPPLPAAPGGDVVGIVEAVGAGITAVQVGERVAAWAASDAYADLVVVDEGWCVAVPDGVGAGAATALTSPGQVALNVIKAGGLREGETVVVHSAAGSIGHLAVQLARALGAGTVVGTTSAPSTREFVRSLGADLVVDYTDPRWEEAVREVTGGQGVDLVLDSIGGDVLRSSVALLRFGGRVVSYGAAGGPASVTRGELLGMNAFVGFSMGKLKAVRPDLFAAARRELFDLAASGRLVPALHASLPLSEAWRAHRIIESRAQRGRVVLVR
ncbi:quinone oxidoreductase family protein [Streptomyces sp. NPDC001139]